MADEGSGSNVVSTGDSGSRSGGGGTSQINGPEGAITIKAPSEHPIRIHKWRVREGFPISSTSQVILLYEVFAGDADKPSSGSKLTAAVQQKLKASRVGVVKKRLFKEGEIVPPGAVVLDLAECVHTTVIKDMCADCGADLRQNENGNTSEASVPMVHSIPDLKVTQKLAQKLGHDDTRRLLQDRKLVLLVDLDQTVIHTTNDNVPNNIKGIYHFQLYGPHSPWYHTRLRPGTPQFLEAMSQYYELHICTFGARNYAHMIAQLLDPDGKFFSHRILSRDECFNATSKTDNLRALFPNGDSMVCIIDDREDVWNMASNLIQVKPYHFFQHTGDINAPPGLSKHELDGEGLDFEVLSSLKTDKDRPDSAEDENKLGSAISEKSDAASEKPTPVLDNIKDEAADDKANTSTRNQENTKDSTNTAKNSTSDEDLSTETWSAQADTPSSKDEASKANKEEPKNAPEDDGLEKESNSAQIESSSTPPPAPDSLLSEPVTRKDIQDLSSVDDTPKAKLHTDSQQHIEIEDPDDYLMYLEVILKRIHTRFYSIYGETQEIPDLKIIVPKIRSEVLRGLNLVFSGLVPTNMKLEQSRAYFIAKSLGAEVTQGIGPDTTHLIAVTSGTFKVNAAKKNPQIKIVNANWLWTCAERWERVEEKLFPLDRKMKSKQRQPPAHCHSPEHVVNYSEKSEISSSSSAQRQYASMPEKFIDTINPLLSFSNADLADMNEEFDQFFESDSSSEDEHVNIENPPEDKTLRKRKRAEKEEERTRDFFTRSSDIMIGTATGEDADRSSNEGGDNEDDDDVPSVKFRRGEELPSDLEMGSDSDDGSHNNGEDSEDDGDWNMMGAALEREFLGLED